MNQLKNKFVIVKCNNNKVFLTKELYKQLEKEDNLKKENFEVEKLSYEICDNAYFFNSNCFQKDLKYKISAYVNPKGDEGSCDGHNTFAASLLISRGLINGQENKVIVILSDPNEYKVLQELYGLKFPDVVARWGRGDDASEALLSDYDRKVSKIYPIDEIVDREVEKHIRH